MPGHRLGDVEDAAQVHTEDLLPFVSGDLQEVVADADPRVVDQDVDSTQHTNGVCDGTLDLFQLRNVTRDELGQTGQHRRELLPGLPVSVQDHHLCAFIQKTGCRGHPDPARPARDDYPLVLETPHDSFLRFLPSVIEFHATPPPSTIKFAPVMYEESSEARKRVARAISSGVPMRPMGRCDASSR